MTGEQYDHPCGVIGFFTTAQPELVKESGDLVKDDTISRQAAINAIRASTSKYTGFMEMEMYTDDDAVEAIEGLPSAQPEIVRCKDCKYVGTDATCCLVCDREGMGLRPFHVRKDDYCSYAERK